MSTQDWEEEFRYMTRSLWRNRFDDEHEFAGEMDAEAKVIEKVRSLLATTEKKLLERVREAIMDYAEPYEGARWLNQLAPKDIDKIFNSLTNDSSKE